MKYGSSLFGYFPPSGVSYGLTGGAVFTSDVVLDNSSPASITVLNWSSAAQTTASACTLQASWQSPIVPGCLAFLGVSIPVGVPVTVKGRRPADVSFSYGLGGNSQSSVVQQLDDGSAAVIFAFDGFLDACVGYELTITNNVGGNTIIQPSQQLYIGESRIFQGFRPGRGIQEKWAPGFDNLMNPAISVNRQPHVVDHRYNHVDSVLFGADNEAAYWIQNNGQISCNRFAHIAATHATLLAIPAAYVNGVLQPNMLANSAIYGYADKIQRPQYMTNHYYQMAMSFVEYPPLQYG